jgi:hydrogenase maturation protease
VQNQSTICIAGIGNTLRSDDGIGSYVCRELEKENIHNATFQYIHQLQTEWIDEFSHYDYVLLIDAAVDKENKIQLNALNPADHLTDSSSHYLGLGIFARLITGLMSTSPSIYLCTIPGQDYSFSETLSPRGKANADEAIKKIKSWLQQHKFMSAPAP